jgi:hypothetical protein
MKCPVCHREYILLPTDPPDQQVCNPCRFGIKVYPLKQQEKETKHDRARNRAGVARAALSEEGADIADAARTKALWDSRTDSDGSDKGFVKIDSVTLREEGKP